MNAPKTYDISEFVEGQKDCKEGKPPQKTTASYEAGYAAQYELDQVMSYEYGFKRTV